MALLVDVFDVVELIEDMPGHGLSSGMQGTILDVYAEGQAFEVEFSDQDGTPLAILAVNREQFLVVWRARTRQWVSLADKTAELVSRMPTAVGVQVLDFARFLTMRSSYPVMQESLHASSLSPS